MGDLAFSKYEGLGNDFVLVESDRDDVVSASDARAICDRRFGVGADGVLVILPPSSTEARARMRVINADGSIPEMCGNGLRCAAVHVAKAARGEIAFDTDAGLRRCAVGADGSVTVDMGKIAVGEDVRLEVDGEAWDLTLADAGNPHAVTTREASRERVAIVGPRIATDPRFPRGTNVEFARFGGRTIDVVVWERGVGITLACGTGACATVAVGVAKGLARANEEHVVRLPGGELGITIDDRGHAIMRGPARRVFSGTIATGARR
jgi:diaminopimelate epimerase